MTAKYCSFLAGAVVLSQLNVLYQKQILIVTANTATITNFETENHIVLHASVLVYNKLQIICLSYEYELQLLLVDKILMTTTYG